MHGAARFPYLFEPWDGIIPKEVTISYRWFAPDYEREALRPLFKKIGGFFVGCSIEGLLALGTVRGHLGINAPKKALINGAEYDMKLYHSTNRRHIRTFYPVFLRGVEPIPEPPVVEPPIGPGGITPAAPGNIRIIAAAINPMGDDVGQESVTIINIGPEANQLNNWSIVDKNGNYTSFSIPSLGAGDVYKIVLDGRGAQLSNKGGKIKLLNENQEMIHLVSYRQGQVKEQGVTTLF